MSQDRCAAINQPIIARRGIPTLQQPKARQKKSPLHSVTSSSRCRFERACIQVHGWRSRTPVQGGQGGERFECPPVFSGFPFLGFGAGEENRTLVMSGWKPDALPLGDAREKMVAERRIEFPISRLSIECFEPTKLLRTKLLLDGAEKRNRTADLLRTGQVLFRLSYFGAESGADGRTRTCDELGVGQPI